MFIFLASLGVLFTATMVAYLIVRFQNASWRTAGQPHLPLGLIASSALILAASGTLAWATSSVRKNKPDAMRRALVATLVLGIAFMGAQFLNWVTLSANNLPPNARSLYAFTFYMLTGVHAIHVVGGFVPLGFCIRNAYRGEYSSMRWNGVKFCAQYWHFLDVVWFVMLVTMWSVT
ncbi:MAG: heme-copper oxidase subunit III [Clostridia bacterium]|nr:heme-copper oxidase subunit III [Deltaproteobacteria bacterium]